jgi:predicted phage terminase large subunit-like protein
MIASQYFPAWLLGMHPEWEIIAASYSLSLPLDFSRRVRALIRDKTYRNVFSNTALDPDKQNAEGWNTTRGGGYVPAGVGGSITGRGAHCLIIDDPFKDAEEADSETIREKVWDWFGSTAYTRLAPNGGVLIIQTRWHDDDLSGRLINHMTEALKEAKETPEVEAHIDKWEIVSYPAIATANETHRKKGEALHPQRFPIGRLYKIKRTLQPRHWSALYQQNPVPDEGVYFRKEMMRFETLPDWRTLPVGIAFDLAIGKKQTNDYTVGAVGCIDSSDRLYVLEVVRARWDTYEIVEAMLDLYERYSSKGATPLIGIERGQLELAIRPHLKKRINERKLYPAFDEDLKPMTDKLARARPLQGRMQQGGLVLPPPETHPWVEMVVQELLRFPGGLFDDIVDALAWLVRMAPKIGVPVNKVARNSRLKSWRAELHKYLKTGASGDLTHMAA